MTPHHRTRTLFKWLAAGAGVAVASYGTYAGVTWFRYGHVRPPSGGAADSLLDRFIPDYDVVERHSRRIAAPADVTFAAAREMNFFQPALVRAIFKARELVFGSAAGLPPPMGLLEQVQKFGWGVLADVPGREVVVGAITQPWNADVVFTALPASEFAAFHEPGYAKIVWTLRADPVDASTSIFRTETRVTTTDPESRRKFRRYWSFVSPGIWLIRRLSLGPLKAEAERRVSSKTI